MRYFIDTLKITLIISLLINSAGHGYALRPMAAGVSTGQGLFDDARQNIWAVMRRKQDPWPAEKLKKYIAIADRKPRLPKPFADFNRPFLDCLELLKKGLESMENEHPGLQANFLLYIAREIKEREKESKYMRYPHGEGIRQLHRNLIKTVFPGSLLAKIKEFKEIMAEKGSSERLKELNALLKKLYGVSFNEVIAYMYSMGDMLTGELFDWVPEQNSSDLRYKIDDFWKNDHSIGKSRYKVLLINLIKRGLHITEGDTVFEMGDIRWSLLLHYFAVKAAERKCAEKEAIKTFDKSGNVKAVFFDVAGVILFYSLREVARGLAELTQEDIFKVIGPRESWEDFDKGKITPQAYFERVKKALGFTNIDYDAFFTAAFSAYKVNPEAVEAIRQLKEAGYKVYALSNCNKAHREYYCKEYDYIFNMLDGFVASYEEGVMKPDVWIFKRALELFGLKPWEAVLVDDSEENAKAALSLGIASIQYQPGETDLQSELVRLIAPRNGLLTERLMDQESALETHRVVAAFSNAA